jgi:hypothetical protein
VEIFGTKKSKLLHFDSKTSKKSWLRFATFRSRVSEGVLGPNSNIKIFISLKYFSRSAHNYLCVGFKDFETLKFRNTFSRTISGILKTHINPEKKGLGSRSRLILFSAIINVLRTTRNLLLSTGERYHEQPQVPISFQRRLPETFYRDAQIPWNRRYIR